MEKLKACPFCGSTNVAISPYDGAKTIVCINCLCQTASYRGEDAEANATAAWNRRAEPENKALTLFDKITESPEKLAKFLGAIDIGKIELDECFCKSDCGDDSGCPHELQCIINWLDKPEAGEKE